MDVSNNNELGDLYIIKDAYGAIGRLIAGIIVLIVGAFLALIFLGAELPFLAIVWCGVVGLIVAMCIQQFRVKNKGYRVDFANDTFSYPGGKAADSVEDIFSSKYWGQLLGLSVQEIRISEIQRVSYSDEPIWDKSSQRYTYNHIITFEGSFGSIRNTFASQGKRDQLFTIMIQKLQMGSPMVIR